MSDDPVRGESRIWAENGRVWLRHEDADGTVGFTLSFDWRGAGMMADEFRRASREARKQEEKR